MDELKGLDLESENLRIIKEYERLQEENPAFIRMYEREIEEELSKNTVHDYALLEGIEQGTKQANIETAKDMLKDDKSIDEIIKYSHLTEEEITALKEEMDK